MTVTGLGKSIDDKKWFGLKAIQEIQKKGVDTWDMQSVGEEETERNHSNIQVPGKSPEI